MNRLKIACIFGTRPELIKMAPVINALLADEDRYDVEVICTGQHKELLIPLIEWFKLPIHRNLDVMRTGQSLNELTGRLMTEFGKLFSEIHYDCVIGQGDTTSVFAAAFAAFHEKIPFVHVEAGLRTFDYDLPFPEEMNRVLVSKLASLHFAPTESAAKNLRNEGISESTLFMIGNTVIDALQYTVKNLDADFEINPSDKKMILVTAHRRENLGEPLTRICRAIRHLATNDAGLEFVFPVHPNPNVRKVVYEVLGGLDNVTLTEPIPYEKLVRYLSRAHLVMTDSGGLQEEAPALGKPVLVLREETERPELVALGGSLLVGSHEDSIIRETSRLLSDQAAYQSMILGYSPYGDGNASDRLVTQLSSLLTKRAVSC